MITYSNASNNKLFEARKLPEQLHDEDIVRRALEAAAKAIESRSGNKLYERAWAIAAEIIRSMKPL